MNDKQQTVALLQEELDTLGDLFELQNKKLAIAEETMYQCRSEVQDTYRKIILTKNGYVTTRVGNKP